jgi:hypothetical protein
MTDINRGVCRTEPQRLAQTHDAKHAYTKLRIWRFCRLLWRTIIKAPTKEKEISMIKTSFIAAALAVSTLGAVVSTPAAAQVSLQVQVAPPPPRFEAAPAPRRGYVWVPGYWDWRRGHHVWTNGHYERARAGYVYAPTQWVQRGDRWEMQRGSWQRGGRGDRDHDGIQNRNDRDRDGDGVPNRVDSNPNNPNRR